MTTATKKRARPANGVPAGQLGDWADEIPEEVQDAADEYMKALRTLGKAREKMNTAKQNCIDVMK